MRLRRGNECDTHKTAEGLLTRQETSGGDKLITDGSPSHPHDEQPLHAPVAGFLNKNALLSSCFWEGLWMQNEMECLQRSAPVLEKRRGCRRRCNTFQILAWYLVGFCMLNENARRRFHEPFMHVLRHLNQLYIFVIYCTSFHACFKTKVTQTELRIHDLLNQLHHASISAPQTPMPLFFWFPSPA